MRFQVSQVMDAIEQRLTTDVAAAQAVANLGEIVRNVDSDGGRPVNLVRIGMAVDALSRYLVDAGAMLYGVVDRALLSESALTSKERMVLGRWADDGVIEVTTAVGDRPAEVADLTGLPLIALRPLPELAGRFGWLADRGGRLLRLTHQSGVAALRPMDDLEAGGTPGAVTGRVVGRAKVLPRPDLPVPAQPGDPAAAATVDATADRPEADAEAGAEAPPAGTSGAGAAAEQAASPAPDRAGASGVGAVEEADPEPSAEDDGGVAAAASDAAGSGSPAEEDEAAAAAGEGSDPGTEAGGPEAGGPEAGGSTPGPATVGSEPTAEGAPAPAPADLPAPLGVFASRGGARIARVLVSRHRYLRAEPSAAHATFLHRQWRCESSECPVFGEHRRIGQPVPRLRGGEPVCPRHDAPVADVGPRQPAYPVSVVVDDLPRRRVVVRGGQPVSVGRADDDPDVLSVAQWLHRAAAAWVGPVHVQLEAGAGGLTVTDLSQNGTVVWQRQGPADPGTTRLLRGEPYLLGEWDSVELYTGIELVRGDRRRSVVLGRDELGSVLVDAPTAAHRQVRAG